MQLSTSALVAILIASILLIVFLIVKMKLHGSIALTIAAFAVALATGVSLTEIPTVIENGVGGTLGFLVLIIGFGAVLGKMLEVSGGAERLASTLLSVFGKERATFAMALLGLLAGIPVFVEVGFVLLVPLVFVVAKQAGISRVKVGVPLAISLMTVHCVLPPHPAATAIAGTLGADVGKVIMLGLVVSTAAALIAGPVFGKYFIPEIGEDSDDAVASGSAGRRNESVDGKGATGGDTQLVATSVTATREQGSLPSFGITLATILLPLLIMVAKTLLMLSVSSESTAGGIISLVGNPITALLISVLFAYWSLGLHRGATLSRISEITDGAFGPIGGVLLIIGAGGAYNAVLTASGVAPALKDALGGLPVSPIVVAWLIAIVLHFAVGSATVAMISAAGIVEPMLATAGISPEIMALAIGAGAIGLTHVTDSLFWMYKEYMKISVGTALRTLTVGTTIASVVALVAVLGLSVVF
ncbi:gluconate:H+ symporter [Trueperella pecoris]|uniref:GntT/GntP/DsdX family permease n=1 Tax=Trueperella pecoris TaxID=2733571 RepID=UPI001ABDF46D|nr:gluconate:H+ symporter [Trueperella pecoris]QTG75800.1 permease DsdX [Trueperella pecoris]